MRRHRVAKGLNVDDVFHNYLSVKVLATPPDHPVTVPDVYIVSHELLSLDASTLNSSGAPSTL